MPAPPVSPAVLTSGVTIQPVHVWAIQIGAVTNTVSQLRTAATQSSEKASVKTSVS